MNPNEAIEKIKETLDYAERNMDKSPLDEIHFAEGRAALAVLSDAVKEGEWQDISTAPKDGTHILLEGGEGYWQDGDSWFSCCSQRTIQWEPKVWMPLPTIPKQPKEKISLSDACRKASAHR